MKATRLLLLAGLMTATGLSGAMGDQATIDKARKVFENNKDSVVFVTAVVNMELTGGGRTLANREQKVTVLGTVIDTNLGAVIDPAGLVVVALSAIDPASSVQGSTAKVGAETVKVNAKSTHSQVKIVLPGGAEVDAKIVLTDDVLDLAFVCPEKAGAKLDAHAVKMDGSPKVEVLDQVVCLGRQSKSMDQAPAAALAEISSIVTKPRHFFTGGRTLGGPVFTLGGDPVGVTASYKAESGGGNTIFMVIVPADEVAKSAKQALARKDEPPATQPAAKEPPKGGPPIID